MYPAPTSASEFGLMMKISARIACVLPLIVMLFGCTKSVDEQSYEAQSIEAGIAFDEEGCPVKVTDEVLKVRRRDTITWRAVDAKGEQANVSFNIFFDPISGRALRSSGSTLREMIDAQAPIALYKYTIVGTGCPDKPLDPEIRVAL